MNKRVMSFLLLDYVGKKDQPGSERNVRVGLVIMGVSQCRRQKFGGL